MVNSVEKAAVAVESSEGPLP